MARLVFSLLAASDLDGIQAYVARNNPHAALRLADRIEETCRRLAGRPLIGRELNEAQRLEALRADIQGGLDQLDRGESVDGDILFARLRRTLERSEP